MAIAAIIGGTGSSGSAYSLAWIQSKDRKRKPKMVNRVKVSSVMDPYKTLRIRPGASESEVKKAFRQLALQYHPDVCRGSNCRVQFQTINEAYDIVMSQSRRQCEEIEMYEERMHESMRGINDPDYDMWEEWMGWEGAGIRDYTSHINPYI